MSAGVRWAWIFLHHEEGGPAGRDAEAVDDAWRFWATVTGSAISARRGDRSEFATLVPVEGDGWVKLQRTLVGDGTHLDLVVDDIDAAADLAGALGAEPVDSSEGVRVMRSPGGYVFCFTSWAAEGRPSQQVRQGQEALLDQLCLDIPASLFEAETAFWSAVTGWELSSSAHEEFRSLVRPSAIPVRLLLQRLGADEGVVSGHPDVACADRAASVQRWVEVGATVVEEHPGWTVMRDPAGLVFCLTDRDPATGRVVGGVR